MSILTLHREAPPHPPTEPAAAGTSVHHPPSPHLLSEDLLVEAQPAAKSQKNLTMNIEVSKKVAAERSWCNFSLKNPIFQMILKSIS